jgi:carboxyl-terminal processing protease
MIIDLRVSSSAQNDWPLDGMLALFQTGTIGEIYNRSESNSIVIEGQDIAGSQKIPLVVLVGEHTSGFPEIFAASIQESGRGVVIGSSTPGNFESLSGFILPDGSNIYIAASSFRLEGNPLLGINGFKPEVQVEARWDQVTATDDPVLQAAIQSFAEVEQ